MKAYKYALPNKSLSLPVPGESWRRSTATVGTTKPTDPAAPGPVHPGIGLVAIAASDSALLILPRTFFSFLHLFVLSGNVRLLSVVPCERKGKAR
jgi:hypothetical protein